MLNKVEKDAIIGSIKEDIGNAKAIFLTNLIGISSNDSVELRKKVRDSNGKIVVTRNTLFEKASIGSSAEEMLKGLKGPSAVAFAFDDAASIAKVLKKAGEDHEVVELKGGILDGEMLSVAQVKELADLPSRDEMLGTLLATFLAPVSAFARLVNTIKDECETQGVESPGSLKVEAAAEAAE
jgi:large subunit ribosomal protein L10